MGKVKTLLPYLLCFWSFSTNTIKACDCGEGLSDWSVSEVQEYDVVFRGKVDSIVPGKTHCLAYFTGTNLYFGACVPFPVIRFDCTTSCQISFYPGDEWIVYALMGDMGYLHVDYCGRSRPRPGKDGEDNYAAYSRISFDREFSLLKGTFPQKEWTDSLTMQKVLRGEITFIDGRRELMHPSRPQIVILLFSSAVIMGLIWVILKKFWRH